VVSTKPYYVEIFLPSKDWPNSLSGKDELDIELLLSPSKTPINVGLMKEISRNCVRGRNDPPHGVDGGGGARGSLSGAEIKSMQLETPAMYANFGFSTEVYEVQYDLDIRLISKFND
jgi:hypothetical protein